MTGRPVRLLTVLSSLGGGGAERQMALLLRHIDRSRFEPSLCLLDEDGPLRSEVPKDIEVTLIGRQSRRDTPKLVTSLARLIRDTQPDIVFSKLYFTNMMVAFAIPLARHPVPFVVGEDSIESVELQRLSYPRLRASVLRWCYGRAARVVVPCEGVADDLRENLDVLGAHRAIPNMVELESLQDAASAPASTRFAGSPLPLLVSAGRLEGPKGQVELLQALALLQSQDRPCNLLLLGDGEDRAHLEELAGELGVADRVEFAGFVREPFALMASADVFVSASHHESFGNVLIEAMALGLPVVSTRVPCGPELIIRDGVTGVFAEPRDPEDLAARIRLVVDDPSLRARLADRGLDEARRYDVGPVVSAYESLLLEAGRAPR